MYNSPKWPWPWPNDLDTQTWLGYGQDVPPYQKWSFYVKEFKSYSPNRQKDIHIHIKTVWIHYLPAYAGSKNDIWSRRINFRIFDRLHESFDRQQYLANHPAKTSWQVRQRDDKHRMATFYQPLYSNLDACSKIFKENMTSMCKFDEAKQPLTEGNTEFQIHNLADFE